MDDRRDAVTRDEGAAFSGAVGGSRPPFAALGLVLIVGAMVAVAALGAGGDGTAAAALATAPAGEAAADALDHVTAADQPLATPPVSIPYRPTPVLRIDAASSDDLLFVHGEVHSAGAVTIRLTVRDGEGARIGSRELSLPSGSTAFRLGAADRFDAMFELAPGTLPASGWITAIALDASGAWVATERVPLPSPREASLRWLEAGT